MFLRVNPGRAQRVADVVTNRKLAVLGRSLCRFYLRQPCGIAQRYLDRVAHFIDVNLTSGNCAPGLEQVALFACLDSLSPQDQHSITRAERSTVVDSHAADEAFCWVAMKAEGPCQEFKSTLIGKYQR